MFARKGLKEYWIHYGDYVSQNHWANDYCDL